MFGNFGNFGKKWRTIWTSEIRKYSFRLENRPKSLAKSLECRALLQTTTTCQQWPIIWGPKGGCYTQVWWCSKSQSPIASCVFLMDKIKMTGMVKYFIFIYNIMCHLNKCVAHVMKGVNHEWRRLWKFLIQARFI